MSDFPQWIVIGPEIRNGKPVIRGTRIAVTDIRECLAGGMTLDEILDGFPDLAADDIRAVIAYPG